MSTLLMLGGSAVVPSLLLLWYIYARDRNPEPRGLLLKTFLLGAAICAPVVPVAMWLESLGREWETGAWSTALVRAFLGAAIPEELFKYLVLRRYVWNEPAFDEPLDGVVYGATASLGFATLENILYVGDGGLGVAMLRALTAVPQHAFTGVIMGAFLGRARFAADGAQRFGLLAAGLGWAILLHGAYDAFLMTETGFALLALPALLTSVGWGRGLYKGLQREQILLGTSLVTRRFAVEEPLLAEEPAPLAVGGLGPTPLSAELGVAQVRLSTRPPREPQRTFFSWLKLGLGGIGLSACGLAWLFVAALLLGEPVGGEVAVPVVVICALPTVLFLLLFRSGLRGPFETGPA
ncbi:MAG TPA: PrsW family intramembrane metalloprotease [Archangium sp.]|uniref:PrsW family intramembrane metalloprotease n=1 Tax=Archangium sp. TaxID=1872627 RepID=UPI002E30F68A|nr:PrsW family intramembrane metalloprotease [Archangium sp.]HEX5747125.1 PrsW family intramembrane metalloprotease [Archangium sp.]